MKHQVLFFHGGAGQEDYEADAKLVDSLSSKLGAKYSIQYSQLPKEDAPDFGRRKQIGDAISLHDEGVILIGHSLGASMLLAYLSENKIEKKIEGIFLLATPFWNGDEDWVKPLKLRSDFATRLNQEIPLFFYHCRNDEEVPFTHFAMYRKSVPWASFREVAAGGHQFNNDLTVVADDIIALEKTVDVRG